ncbi:MAG: 50S ribosomal protein L11 methyltransferase [Methanomassiliicoccales archaeon]|nr:50S ribosomal protein L11 methyltransferase [Methanomassiliicoccales archaeon]
MRRRELEMTLQSLEGFTAPRPELEQYSTPAVIAADLLFEALARGDVEGKSVLDLGCGTGVLGIGASLLGAKRVLGVDRDPQAIEQARANALRVGASVEFQEMGVDEMREGMDTVIMNPPFGAQRRGADRPFLIAAMRCAPVIYSLHLSQTEGFVQRFTSRGGFQANVLKRYKFGIPYMFEFHSKIRKDVEVTLFYILKIGVS